MSKACALRSQDTGSQGGEGLEERRARQGGGVSAWRVTCAPLLYSHQGQA